MKAGLDAAYNPYWSMLDPSRVGIAGHSYGAAGVSYIGQWDPRVKAIVAWDNLGGADPNAAFIGGNPPEQPCPRRPVRSARAVPITKPALGMSADYFIPPKPNTSDPDPLAKSHGVARVLEGGRRHRRDHHPRRHALRLRLDPEPRLPGDAARRRRDRLVHDRVVRQVREGRLHGRRAAAHRPLARRRRGGGGRPATTTATCSASTTARGSTSGSTAAAASSARTCAPAAPEWWRRAPTGGPPTTNTSSSSRRLTRRRRVGVRRAAASTAAPASPAGCADPLQGADRPRHDLHQRQARTGDQGPPHQARADPRRGQRQARGEDRAALIAGSQVYERPHYRGCTKTKPRRVRSRR